MNQHDHPFLRPLWRRVVLVAICFCWAAFEFAAGSQMWGMIVLFMGAYGAWQYLYLYKPAAPDEPASTAPEE